MRLAVAAGALLALLSTARADACGTAAGFIASESSPSTPPDPERQTWVYFAGGASNARPGERTAYGPVFHAGLGGSLHRGESIAVGPLLSALYRPTVATAPSSTDLALSVRASTLGFRDGFGAAIDVGGFARVSGGRAFGPSAGVTLGAPYGLQAIWLVEVPREGRVTQALLFGIDLARR